MELYQHRAGNEGAAEHLWLLIATAATLVFCLSALAASGCPVPL